MEEQTVVARMSIQGHFQPKAAVILATDKSMEEQDSGGQNEHSAVISATDENMLTTMPTIDDFTSSNTLPADILKDKTFCDLEAKS